MPLHVRFGSWLRKDVLAHEGDKMNVSPNSTHEQHNGCGVEEGACGVDGGLEVLCQPSLSPIYFFPHFVSRISPIVPPEIVSPSTGLPRKMILVSSLYSFGPNLFHALHGGLHPVRLTPA
jgi:hypothetical protein